MKVAQQWEPKQWVLKKVKSGWTLVWNFPARGTATRNHKRGREPFSHLESRSISPSARALQEAMQGDTEAYAGLTAAIAGNVLSIAQDEGWQRVDMAMSLRVANALMALTIADKRPNNAQVAEMIHVAEQNYHLRWKQRMAFLEVRCIKPLAAELSD